MSPVPAYAELPLELVEPDPEAEIRFSYDVDDLAEDIRTRGQLQPVLAYRKGQRYYVFVGLRRYHAVKRLHDAEGSPEAIRALVFDREPDRSEKLGMMMSENSRRSDLTIYEKIALFLQHPDLPIFSKRFAIGVKEIMPHLTVKELRRWYEIERRLGSFRLRLQHLRALASLRPEERDFAVFFMNALGVEDPDRYDLRALFMNTPLSQELRGKLRELNIAFPYREAGGAEAPRGAPAASDAGAESDGEPWEAEEERRALLMSGPVQVLVQGLRVHVFYMDREPEVVLRKVSDGEVVEMDGRRYVVRVL
ncbi:MAG: ParB/RepB/Spo0J family partition protein [Nitrososphaeria archaeon]